jgi:hypothetical protein
MKNQQRIASFLPPVFCPHTRTHAAAQGTTPAKTHLHLFYVFSPVELFQAQHNAVPL